MKCVYCGSENGPGAGFCQTCGQPLRLATGEGPAGVRRDPPHFQYAKKVESQSDMISMKTEKFLFRLFGGIGWLMISLGTFIVGFGVLGLVDSIFSYDNSPEGPLRTIGYGVIVYAIAAIFVAMNRFVKSQ